MEYKIQNLNLYFDTNILKKIGGNLLKFEVNETYHVLKKFIMGNELDFINIYIPNIVIEELLAQYIRDYTETQNSCLSELDALVAKAKTLNWDIELTKRNDLELEEYKQFIRKSASEFFENEAGFANVIDYCSSEKFQKIIERAIGKKKPFFGGKSQNKAFSDAGFKDVVFLETILEHMENEDGDYIIFCKDALLSDVNLNKELPHKNGEIQNLDLGWKVVNLIKDRYGIDDYSEIITLCRSIYFKEMLENSLKCELLNGFLGCEKQEINDQEVIKINCKVLVYGENKEIIVELSDAMDFLEVIDAESQEVIFEW